LGDQIEKNEMGAACSMYGREERFVLGFDGGNMRERDHLEDPGIDGRILLRWTFRKWDGGGALSGLIWLRIGTGGGYLCMW
jgi:hypothetical protein